MALQELNMQSLADLAHGAVGVAVNNLIRKAIRDQDATGTDPTATDRQDAG